MGVVSTSASTKYNFIIRGYHSDVFDVAQKTARTSSCRAAAIETKCKRFVCLILQNACKMESRQEMAMTDRVGRIERLKKLLERIVQEQTQLIVLQDQLVQDQTTMIIQNQAALDVRMKDLGGKVQLLEQKGDELRGEQDSLQV